MCPKAEDLFLKLSCRNSLLCFLCLPFVFRIILFCLSLRAAQDGNCKSCTNNSACRALLMVSSGQMTEQLYTGIKQNAIMSPNSSRQMGEKLYSTMKQKV